MRPINDGTYGPWFSILMRKLHVGFIRGALAFDVTNLEIVS